AAAVAPNPTAGRPRVRRHRRGESAGDAVCPGLALAEGGDERGGGPVPLWTAAPDLLAALAGRAPGQAAGALSRWRRLYPLRLRPGRLRPRGRLPRVRQNVHRAAAPLALAGRPHAPDALPR